MICTTKNIYPHDIILYSYRYIPVKKILVKRGPPLYPAVHQGTVAENFLFCIVQSSIAVGSYGAVPLSAFKVSLIQPPFCTSITDMGKFPNLKQSKKAPLTVASRGQFLRIYTG
jgi:hypothetical protein